MKKYSIPTTTNHVVDLQQFICGSVFLTVNPETDTHTALSNEQTFSDDWADSKGSGLWDE